MNISILVARAATLGAILIVAFSFAYVANAEVAIESATLNGVSTPAIVEPNATVAVDLIVTRTGEDEFNDWEGTSYKIGDEAVVCLDIPNPDVWQGNDNSTTTFDIIAPSATGTYEVVIGIYRDDVNSEGASDNNPCPSFQRSSTTLTLIVEESIPVIEPYYEVLSLKPSKAIRNPGDSVTYTSTIVVGGDPVSAHVQCVVFDILNGDGWQEVPVNLNATGTYMVDQIYNLTGFATGTYEVISVAFDFTCAEIPEDFDTSDFDTVGLYATTTLTVGEAYTLNINITGNGMGNVQAQGNLSDDISCYSDSGLSQDCSGIYASGTVITLVANADSGSNTNSLWTTVSGNPGTCTGNTTPCQVTMTGDVTLTANFALTPTNIDGGGGGGGSTGRGERLSLRDPDYNTTLSDRDDDEDEDEDDDNDGSGSGSTGGTGQVLGESTTIIPLGAPNTGAGGAAPLSVNLPVLTAILTSARNIQKSN